MVDLVARGVEMEAGVAFRLLATLAFVVVVACFAAAAGRVERASKEDGGSCEK